MARLILSLAINFLILLSVPAHAQVGSITGFTGAGTIKHQNATRAAARNAPVDKNDTVSTNSRGRFQITFKDSTTVNITENSRLVIDDFVYDGGGRSGGRLALRAALGTMRYKSGGIAHQNPNGVRVRTPTSTIAVRGTNFVMSVDEVGRSTVVLVPECYDDDITKINFDCPAGEIDVITSAGIVTMNQPFQATMAENSFAPPAPPVIVNPSQGFDNNIQITPLETDDGQSLLDLARDALKKYTNPSQSAADENQDPDTGDDSTEEVAVATRREATQEELQELYAAFNDGEIPQETIYTNVSPTFQKNVQVGWVYTRLSEDKQQAVTIFLPEDTETQVISVQNSIADSYNFMDHKWTTSGTGRPQGNITVIQNSGVP